MLIPFSGTLELGLIYALVAMGVYLTFRVIDFADLSVDGSFPLGAAVAAACIVQGGNPIFATCLAMFAGVLAGSITGILHVYFKIMSLLSGILTMTALYSLNLRVMGKPNIALMDSATIFSVLHAELGAIIVIVVLVCAAMIYFLRSHYGLSLRALGINPQLCRSYGVSVHSATIVALAISNGLAALAGALFAQAQGFADVSLGTGTVIIGLAAVMIGEAVLPMQSIVWKLAACVLGSVLYRFVMAVALHTQTLGLQVSDLNLVTVMLVVIVLVVRHLDVPSQLRGRLG